MELLIMFTMESGLFDHVKIQRPYVGHFEENLGHTDKGSGKRRDTLSHRSKFFSFFCHIHAFFSKPKLPHY